MQAHVISPRRRLARAAFLSLIPLLLGTSELWATRSGSDGSMGDATRVVGVVVAAGSGVPLPGVLIEVEGSATQTTSGARGRFELSDLPANVGELTIRFTRMGFAPHRETLALASGLTTRLEIELREQEAIALDPIAILLERTRMVGDPLTATSRGGSAFHLGREDLATRRLAFDNVHDVLRQVPGVNVQDEEGYGLRPHIGMRGAGAERSSNVTLMEDGVLIAPAPYAAPAAYYFPSVGRMDGIEVRKGASQIRYGPRTLAGAVNLITAPIPDRQDWELDLSGGEDGMFRGHARVGDSSPHFGWLLEGYSVRTDGFKELQGGGDTGFDTRDLMGKFRVNSDRSKDHYQELELKLGYTDHVSDETYLGLTESDFHENGVLRYAGSGEDVMDAEHRQLQLRYFLRPGQRTELVVTAYRNEFARNWYKLQSVRGVSIGAIMGDPASHAPLLQILRGEESEPDALHLRANNREYVSEGIQAVFGWRPGSLGPVSHNLELGLRLHRDDEDRLQWEDGYRMNEERLVRTSTGTPGSQGNRLSAARALAVYAQNELRTDRWSLIPGVRFETIELARTDWGSEDGARIGESAVRESTVSSLIPGVGISFDWSPWTQLFGGVHRGFGPPGPGATEETRVEESVNYEAGFRVRRRSVGANLTGFVSDYSNILGQATLATGESGVGQLYNGGAVHVAGVEAAVDVDLSRALGVEVAVPVRAAYTFTRGVFRSSFESEYGPWGTVTRGDRLPYLPEHTASGSLGVEDVGWGVTATWNAAGTMRTRAGVGPIPEAARVDRALVFNLSGERNFGAHATAYVSVQNLTDERYVVSRRPAGARPGLPRTFFTGVRIFR